jgi:hypothetical protein
VFNAGGSRTSVPARFGFVCRFNKLDAPPEHQTTKAPIFTDRFTQNRQERRVIA